MSVLRGVIVWMAGNDWLRDHLPRMWFARKAVRRFLPGEDQDSVLAAATNLARSGIGGVLTRLGENVTSADEAKLVVADYLALLDEVRRRRLDAEISVKPTQLGLDLDFGLAESNLRSLASRAAEDSKAVWIDMEGSAYTERTLELYERIKPTHPLTGVCLQAYLLRTASDAARLLPLAPAIRLVKGAYAEPREIAFRGPRINQNYAELAKSLLRLKSEGSQVRLVLGTHDSRLIQEIDAYARSRQLPRRSFEVHMLDGVRVDEQQRLAADGYLMRTLVSYGRAWYAWYMRRLAERPANLGFALRQLIP